MNIALENILPLGVLTGSRAFNCATEKSDWDIVIIESLVPKDLEKQSWDYTCHEIYSASDECYHCDEMQSDLGDDGLIPYDSPTIWGPIISIIKYWYPIDENDYHDEGVWINLFVYPDEYKYLYDNFQRMNAAMLFIHNVKLIDKDYRIEAFIKHMEEAGITNA